MTSASITELRQTSTSAALITIGQYTLGRTLGTGGFGKVKLGVHAPTRCQVAVKVLNRQTIKSLQLADKTRKEIEHMMRVQHPHVVKLYEVVSTPTDIYMILEYVSGGELFAYLARRGRLQEPEARRFFQQIIAGVDYCHRRRIVHRDLKPENLLLDYRCLNVKIADFGLSKMLLDGEFMRTSCGSPHYAAPEVISGKLYAGPEVDVWSCGVILYALLSGALPFEGKDFATLYGRICSGQYVLPPHFRSAVAAVIRRMLQVNPIRRLTIAELKRIEWFRRDAPAYILDVDEASQLTATPAASISDVCRTLNVAEPAMRQALQSGQPWNHLAIAYNLTMDQQRQVPEPQRQQQTKFKPDIISSRPLLAPASSSSGQEKNQKRQQCRAKWHLGVCSPSQPSEIMGVIYQSLLALGFEWRHLNSYHIHVRRLRGPMSQPNIKVAMQLYSATPKSFLIDFKSISEELTAEQEQDNNDDDGGGGAGGGGGHRALEFLDMCAKIITHLAK